MFKGLSPAHYHWGKTEKSVSDGILNPTHVINYVARPSTTQPPALNYLFHRLLGVRSMPTGQDRGWLANRDLLGVLLPEYSQSSSRPEPRLARTCVVSRSRSRSRLVIYRPTFRRPAVHNLQKSRHRWSIWEQHRAVLLGNCI